MLLKSFLQLLQIATILSLYDAIIGGVNIHVSASQDQDSVPALRANKRRSFVSDNKIGKKGNKDSSFDLYVFSMSYQPEFCYQNRKRSYDGCENPIDFWRGSLTIHGLWPERKDGTWPSTCSSEKFDPETISKVGKDRFNTYWPNVKASSSSSSSTYYSFWSHEWTKHGTCSGLNQHEYFNTTLNHFLDTPPIVRERYGASITKQELLDAYDINVVLVCSGGGKFLSEVRMCVGRDANGDATVGVDCIIEVEEEGNCEDEIKITKFYVDKEADEKEKEREDIAKKPVIMSALLSDW
jgi:ribonuclease T2